MAAAKSKKTQNTSKKVLIIAIIIFLLIAIPVALGAMVNNPKAQGASYQGSTYTAHYPKNWTVKKTDRSDTGGTEVILQPPDGAPPESPQVIIDAAPATQQAAVNKLTDPFTIFKYTKTDATVNGINAEKYTTAVYASEGVLRSTAYVFQAKGNIYVLVLEYKQQTPDTEMENDFKQIVNTFAVK